MNRKPIRVFWSPLTERFFATRFWREVPGKPGLVECTGERFDVTNDIAGIMEREEIEFTKVTDQERMATAAIIRLQTRKA
jgi:hypothetical protein